MCQFWIGKNIMSIYHSELHLAGMKYHQFVSNMFQSVDRDNSNGKSGIPHCFSLRDLTTKPEISLKFITF